MTCDVLSPNKTMVSGGKYFSNFASPTSMS